MNEKNKKIAEHFSEIIALCENNTCSILSCMSAALTATILGATEDPAKRLILAALAAKSILEAVKSHKDETQPADVG